MTNILRLSVILAIVTAVAAFVLAEIYGVTKPLIEEQKKAKTEAALKYVLPAASLTEEITQKIPVKDGKGTVLYEKDEVIFYKGYADKKKSQLAGYAFKAYGPGYSSIIETIVGIDTLGNITKIKIVFQKETPGLGALCEKSEPFDGKKWSTQQFNGKSMDNLKVDKDGGHIVSITGATITSRAITNSIKDKLKDLLPKLQNREEN